jgi:hypothetical protein
MKKDLDELILSIYKKGLFWLWKTLYLKEY